MKTKFLSLLFLALSFNAIAKVIRPGQEGTINNLMQNNTVIEFQRGKTYNFSNPIIVTKAGILFNATGSGALPIIRLNNANKDQLFDIRANNVKFKNLNLVGDNAGVFGRSVIKVTRNITKLLVENCTIKNSQNGINSTIGYALNGLIAKRVTFSNITDVCILILNRKTNILRIPKLRDRVEIRNCTFEPGYDRAIVSDNGNDFTPFSKMVNGVLKHGNKREEYATNLKGSIIAGNTFKKCKRWHIGMVQSRNAVIRDNRMDGPNGSEIYSGCLHFEQFVSDIRIFRNVMTNNYAGSRGFLDMAAKEGIRRIGDNKEPYLFVATGSMFSRRGSGDCDGKIDKNCKVEIHRYGPRRFYIYGNTFKSNVKLEHGISFTDAEGFFIGQDQSGKIAKNKWEVGTVPTKGKIRITKGDQGNCNIKIRDNLAGTDIYYKPNKREASLNKRNDCIILGSGNTSKENRLKSNEAKETVIDSDSFSFYPNPASNMITIQTGNEASYTLEIHDIFGKKVKQVNVDSGNKKYTLNLSNMAKGVYLMSYIRKGQVSKKERLILK
ncbi:T9SS type A sorting domain-containing protein [Flavivirga abyssicola]|uniref:T9SS type A sorting domain-containing protein n=1 Tax=Flavivirga abyssicola TaxID=3063533 RepID=UPI0026DEEE71|nr:T9SS type A sorting domain-containing protein [Flavivirga sp. MEBiC07777]WVK12276.1 T9SS type A sorting domain-containing protein [Flavivirga sp. MEBiC07777]